MRHALVVIAVLLCAAPAWAQAPKAPEVTVRSVVERHDVELVILRARVDVLNDALVAAQAQIKVLTAQVEATGAIANARFAETRQRWEPELLKAHGHVADGWTWDWEKWIPKAPEPAKEPEKPAEPVKK